MASSTAARRSSSRRRRGSPALLALLPLAVVALASAGALAQLPEPGNGGGPGGAISSLFRSLAGKGGEQPVVAPASSSAVGPAVSTDNSLASGKDPPFARSDAFQSSANAGKLLGGGTFPETGDPTTGNQVPVPATLSSKAQTAAPADWVPPASGQLAPRDANYDAESSTLSTAQAKQDRVLNGVTVGAKARAEKSAGGKEEEEEVARGGATSALAAAASGLLDQNQNNSPRSSSSPAASAASASPPASPLDATGTKSFKSAKPAQLAKLVAPAGVNSQAASWPNATRPQPPPGSVATLRSQDPNIAALDRAQGVPPVPATSVLSDGSIAGGNANYGKQVDVSIVANLSYPGPGLKGEKVTVCHFPSPTFQGTGADPYTVKPLFLPAPAADLLLGSAAGNGFDFAAPPPGSSVFGPGCVSYDSQCSFGYNGIPCSGHGVCQSTLPNSCLCANGWKSCGVPGSNGCETNTNRDINNCGACGKKCPGADDPTKNVGCCGGKCFDLNGDGGPTAACGRCGQPCLTSNGNASCTAGTCSLSCNPRFSACNATSLSATLNLNVPICVDTTVNPLFCGGCTSRCPFDRFGATSCGQFGNGVNATAAACKVTCSPSYPTQCGTVAKYNASSAKLPPTSNCVNTNQDINNCGGCGIRCPQAPGSVSSCAISPVTGKPACFTTCSFGLTPCVLGSTRFSACVDIFGLDNQNCGDCNVQCASGEQCFYGQCFPIGSFGFAEFGFGFGFAAQSSRRASVAGLGAGGLNSTYALEGNLTAGGLVPLPPSQLTDGLPAWGELKRNLNLSGAWWRRRRRRKTNSSGGLVGASSSSGGSGSGGGPSLKLPNYDDDAEFYDDLEAIVEPYRAYMDLRPVEMRPELLSAAPSSVAGNGGGGGSGAGLVGASSSSAGGGSSPHGDVALFPSYNPKTVAALPSSAGAGSSLLGGAPGALVNPIAAARFAAYLKAHPELTSREGVLVAGETVLEQLGTPTAAAAASSARKARRKARYEAARSAELAAQKEKEAAKAGGGGGKSPFSVFAGTSEGGGGVGDGGDAALGAVAGALSSAVQGTPAGGTLSASAKADVCAPPEYTGPQPVVFARAVARPSAPASTEAPASTSTKRAGAPSPSPAPAPSSAAPPLADPPLSADELARQKSDLSGAASAAAGGFVDDQTIAGGGAPLLGADDPTQADAGGAGGLGAAGGGSTKPPAVAAGVAMAASSSQQQQMQQMQQRQTGLEGDEEIDPQVAAQQAMAAILAHELEAAAEGRGVRADVERQEAKDAAAAAAAAAKAAAASPAPSPAVAAASPKPPVAAAGTGSSGVLPSSGSTSSVADATTAAAARKEADSAAAAAAAAERAGPAARREPSSSSSSSKPASSSSSSSSSFPKDVSASAGGNGAQIGR